MNLYFVQLRAAPTAAVPQAAGMRDADCLIFVMADNPDQALTLAQAYVTHYGWLPAADATIRQPADHVVAQLEPDIQSLAHQARRQGIAAMFVTASTVADHPDTPASYQTLVAPAGASNSRH